MMCRIPSRQKPHLRDISTSDLATANQLSQCCGMWIRTGFNADLDPAFYLHANADPDPGSQTNADPCGSGV
jgi:hypothetical protein